MVSQGRENFVLTKIKLFLTTNCKKNKSLINKQCLKMLGKLRRLMFFT